MTRALLVPAVLALAASACSHANKSTAAASTKYPTAAAPSTGAAGAAGGGMAGLCPMAIPGTHVSAADTATGEALSFTTSPDQAAALREKVHAMADMHNRHHASGDATPHGGTGGGMAGMEMPPPSRAAVEDLPDGARITVTPNAPADLQKLQTTIRSHAEQLEQHGCGTMMDHDQAQHGS
jgi:hypothetical protein